MVLDIVSDSGSDDESFESCMNGLATPIAVKSYFIYIFSIFSFFFSYGGAGGAVLSPCSFAPT